MLVPLSVLRNIQRKDKCTFMKSNYSDHSMSHLTTLLHILQYLIVFNEPITSQQLSAVRHVTVSQCLNLYFTHMWKKTNIWGQRAGPTLCI